MKSHIAVSAIAFLMISRVQAAPVTSYFPKQNLGQFLADKFDLASIRSSFGPRRSPALRTFSDFGMKPTTATDNVLKFEKSGDWQYEFRIVGRRDVNGDGIEDLEVCFIDRALNGGTYSTSGGLLITRFSTDSYAIALSFGIDDEVCENYAR